VGDIENAPSSRTLELNRLSEVVIFTTDLPSPRLTYLDYVRLMNKKWTGDSSSADSDD
jgi:hypothetical protein